MKEQFQPIDEELYKRILLTHRFGLSLSHSTFKGSVYSVEELPFEIALSELKRSFSEFITSRDQIEKILNILRNAMIHKLPKFSIKDSHVIIQSIASILLEFYTAEYLANFEANLSPDKILMVPLKTVHVIEQPDKKTICTDKIKAVVLFEDRLIKINGLGSLRLPGLRFYRIKPYDKKTVLEILNTYIHSFEHPLDAESWDKSLHTNTAAEKMRHITKKEQSVGNGSWLTCKLLIFATVFATLFKFCKIQGLKDLEIDPIALSVAESWYKLFIVDDRNRAVRYYLQMHGFYEVDENLTVAGRIQSIKQFLRNLKVGQTALPVDRDILIQISLKSLNWLLADYLKKGDIGEAHALIEEEASNKLWNPLFYAAKNGKNAIAEMLASNAHYVTEQDVNGNSPLHWAGARGNVEMCKIFLKYKDKNKMVVELQNNEGNTVLHEAIKHGKIEVAELFMKKFPILLAIRNQNSSTPLKLACDLANPAGVLSLLGHGAKIESINIPDYPAEIQKILLNPPKLFDPLFKS